MSENEPMSKSQLKKLAKMEARRLAKETNQNTNVSKSVAPTAEEDHKHRLQYAEEQRTKFSTLYQPPILGVNLKWTGLMRRHFNPENKETLMASDKKYTNNVVTILGQISSCRSAGKLGFMTLYFPPEDVYDLAVVNQLGVILRPEVQVLIRPQEFQIASIKQQSVSDESFPGLPIPKYIIDIQKYENDEEKESKTIEYIKQLTRKDSRVFDQFYIIGYPGYSNTGERTIYAKHIFPASINHLMVNHLHGAEEHGLHQFSNTEVAYRNPFLRWMYDIQSLHTQLVRSKFQNVLRNMLSNEYQLMEVDIPHLLTVASGANAKPFKTHQDDGDVDYMMRIAPELELKMCIVGGLSTYGVFNIGSQFRNEGQDTTHNPEFRSCEFYMRMKSFHQLLQISEKIIKNCCIETLKATNPITMEQYVNNTLPEMTKYDTIFKKEDGTGYCIQWNKPFVNINFVDGINSNLQEGFQLPDPRTFETEESLVIVKEIATAHKVAFKDGDSISKILDNMFDDLVLVNTFRDDLPNSYFKERDADGNLVITPVTVFGHPKVMSPLAMEIAGSGLVYRFESFVAGMEICNAYQELSDPEVQRKNFEVQQKFQEGGDDEAMNANDTFMKALEYGMSPVAGWGMGLERMYMLLTNNYSIRAVLPFPQMKPE
jgi:lysyl-tRNA synthetase class II